MGDLNQEERLRAAAIEWPLPWGPVIRGVRIGEGPSVAVLLHEPGTDLDAWRDFPAQLARELPLTVIALDLPGHGLSDDPWEPERLGEVVRVVLNSSRSSWTKPAPGARPHPNPSPVGPGEGLVPPLPSRWERGLGGEGLRRESRLPESRRFLITAGASATAALELAAQLQPTGLICLSPAAPDPQRNLTPSPQVPKLIVAGSLAGDDLQTARRFGSQCGGWTVVTAFPVDARGTSLLAFSYAPHLREAMTTFLRDCLWRPALARMMPPRG